MTDKKSQPDTLTQLLAIINQLNLKAFSSESQEALIFLIVNDTRKLLPYDRALLWRTDGAVGSSCVGISGHAVVEQESPVIHHTERYLKQIEDLSKPQIVALQEGIPGQPNSAEKKAPNTSASALWLPIRVNGVCVLGLWLERWKGQQWTADESKVLDYLMQGYAAAFQRHQRWWRLPHPSTRVLLIVCACLLILLFFIPVPLRVVAPCEIVPKDPYLVTAPLDGIIAEMYVQPGEVVTEKQLLFSYDKRVPLQELQIAKTQVEITRSQHNRVMTLGLNDPKSLNEAAVWELELAKEQVKQKLAEYRASQLDVTSPIAGITLFDNPDDWRGRPVTVGERVLVVSEPNSTKIKIWVPERDNVVIETEKPIKIFLNTNPTKTYYAQLTYISNYSAVSEKGVPSFSAEAEWLQNPEGVKLGLKGTAVLYGENVSIFYWLMRKPWASLREILGF